MSNIITNVIIKMKGISTVIMPLLYSNDYKIKTLLLGIARSRGSKNSANIRSRKVRFAKVKLVRGTRAYSEYPRICIQCCSRMSTYSRVKRDTLCPLKGTAFRCKSSSGILSYARALIASV
jgi:hypothetical protein